MNACYNDIMDLISEEPKWFDENAVPRYCDFSPDKTANIYADEIVFMRISCQGCGREFKVCISSNKRSRYFEGTLFPSLKEKIKNKEIHYGDPPNVYCCAAGNTMSSVPIEVLEYWERSDEDRFLGKVRNSEFEVRVVPDWALDTSD
jgi:hypothetical protein